MLGLCLLLGLSLRENMVYASSLGVPSSAEGSATADDSSGLTTQGTITPVGTDNTVESFDYDTYNALVGDHPDGELFFDDWGSSSDDTGAIDSSVDGTTGSPSDAIPLDVKAALALLESVRLPLDLYSSPEKAKEAAQLAADLNKVMSEGVLTVSEAQTALQIINEVFIALGKPNENDFTSFIKSMEIITDPKADPAFKEDMRVLAMLDYRDIATAAFAKLAALRVLSEGLSNKEALNNNAQLAHVTEIVEQQMKAELVKEYLAQGSTHPEYDAAKAMKDPTNLAKREGNIKLALNSSTNGNTDVALEKPLTLADNNIPLGDTGGLMTMDGNPITQDLPVQKGKDTVDKDGNPIAVNLTLSLNNDVKASLTAPIKADGTSDEVTITIDGKSYTEPMYVVPAHIDDSGNIVNERAFVIFTLADGGEIEVDFETPEVESKLIDWGNPVESDPLPAITSQTQITVTATPSTSTSSSGSNTPTPDTPAPECGGYGSRSQPNGNTIELQGFQSSSDTLSSSSLACHSAYDCASKLALGDTYQGKLQVNFTCQSVDNYTVTSHINCKNYTTVVDCSPWAPEVLPDAPVRCDFVDNWAKPECVCFIDSNHAGCDSVPPSITLAPSSTSYVKEIVGFPSPIPFPAITRFNDFTVSISDNIAVQSVSAHIIYWDGSSETLTPPVLNTNHSTSTFTSGSPFFNTLITLKKPGNASITLTVTDTAGNTSTALYTIDTDFLPRLQLDTAGWIDFRSQTLTVTPQDFARTLFPSAEARYKKVGNTYHLVASGAAITPNFHYILRNSANTIVKEYPSVTGDGVLPLSTDLASFPDGEYTLTAIYSDNFVPESSAYESEPAIILVDNTDAPSLTFTPAVPSPSSETKLCNATDVAVPAIILNGIKTTFLNCKTDVQASGFSPTGKRDVYVLESKQFASGTEASIPTDRQAINTVVVTPVNRGADHIADDRLIRTDAQTGSTATAKTQAVVTKVSEIAIEKLTEILTETPQPYSTIEGANTSLNHEISKFIEKTPLLKKSAADNTVKTSISNIVESVPNTEEIEHLTEISNGSNSETVHDTFVQKVAKIIRKGSEKSKEKEREMRTQLILPDYHAPSNKSSGE